MRRAREPRGKHSRPTPRRPSRESVGRRVRRQERELSRAGEDRRRARAAARDVYSAIGYEAMFPDGICEVEEGSP